MNTPMPQVQDPYVLVDSRYGTMLANRHDTYIGRSLIDYGEYCELETQFLLRCIDRPGSVVEVGANIGSQTVALAKAAKAVGGDVVAFEPQPLVFQNLCANLALNAIDNVAAWPFACSDEPGTVWIEFRDYGQSGNFGGVAAHTAPVAGGIKMPCVRLDDMLSGRRVSLLKVDVEGFELRVLQGARETLGSCRPVVYVENDRAAQSPALIEYLWQQGYRLWWHITPLFNPQNFRARTDNAFSRVAAFNMIGLPRESNVELKGYEEILDSTLHPLSPAQS